MPAFFLRRACACVFGVLLCAASVHATAACNSSFADAVGQVITGTLELNESACNLTYLVVRETGTLKLFDQQAGDFVNGASDLSGSTSVQDAALDNWGLLSNGARGQFYNIRQLINRGTVQNDGAMSNLFSITNFATVTNGVNGVMTNASPGYFENYGNLTNRSQWNNDGELNNYHTVHNEASGTMVSQGRFTNRSGGTLTNDGSLRLLGVSMLEAGSTFINTKTLDVGGRLLLQGKLLNGGTLNVLADDGDGLSGLTLAAGADYDFTTGMLSVSGTLMLETDFTKTADKAGHLEFKPGSTIINRAGATFTTSGIGIVNSDSLHSVTFLNEGTLSVASYFIFTLDNDHPNSHFDNAVGARVEIKPTGILAFAQPTSNSGVIHNEGALYISQSVTNLRGGLIENTGYIDVNTTLWNDGELVNSGTVKVVGPLPFNGLAGQGRYVQTAGTTLIDGDMAQGEVTIHGGLVIVNGTLTTTNDPAFPALTGLVTLLGGELGGNGVINGEGLVVGGGPGVAQFRPGSSPGSFTINGNFVLLPGGEMELEVTRGADGLLAFDFVKADHMVLDGLLHFKLGPDLGGASLVSLSMLDCGSGCDFGSSFAYVIDDVTVGASVSFSSQGVTLSIPAAAVPEPASLALLLAGLVFIGMRLRNERSMLAGGGLRPRRVFSLTNRPK